MVKNQIDSGATTVVVDDAQLQQLQDEAIRQENNITLLPQDSEKVEENQSYLTQFFEECEAVDVDEEKGNPKWKVLTTEIRSRFTAVDDEGNPSEELQEKTEATVWEIAKNQVFAARAFDKDFSDVPFQYREAILEKDLRDHYAATTARLMGATAAVDLKQDEDTDAKARTAARMQESLDAIDRFLAENSQEKGTIKSSAVIAAAVDMSNKLDSLIKYAQSQNYSDRVAGFFKRNSQVFSEKMKGFWGKAYTGFKEHVSNNKARVATDTVASLAMLGTSAAFPIAAPIAYGAYAAAGSYVWPVIEQKNKMEKAYTEKYGKGARFNKMDYFKKLKLSYMFLKKKNNGKDFENYKTRAGWSAVAGAATAGILGAWGASAMSEVTKPVVTRAVGVVSRSVGAVAAQLTHFFGAKNNLKKEDTAENRADYKNAKTNLIVGGSVSAIFAGISLVNIFDASAMTTDNVTERAKDALLNDPAVAANDSVQPPHDYSEVDSLVKAQNPDITSDVDVSTDVQPTEIDVPQTYDESMGINEHQWNTVHKTGDFDSKYINAENLRNADSDAFINTDGSEMTTTEFVYKSDRIMSLAKAYSDGHGGYVAHMYDENHVEVFAAENGWVYKDGTVVTSTDIAPECWGTEEEVAAFRALYHAVNCGDSVEGVDNDAFNSLYAKIGTGTRGAYMDVDDCGRVHFIRTAVKRAAKVARVPVEEPTPQDAEINHVEVRTAVQADGTVDQGEISDNAVFGRTSTAKGGYGNVTAPGAVNSSQAGSSGVMPGTVRVFQGKGSER